MERCGSRSRCQFDSLAEGPAGFWIIGRSSSLAAGPRLVLIVRFDSAAAVGGDFCSHQPTYIATKPDADLCLMLACS
jgi:hypothetical protein